ncbi:MAG: thioredoxin [Acidimicrobiia bacterium]
MSKNTVTVSTADFDEVISSSKPTLVDFWAEWCGPCRAVAPILEEIASDYPDQITIAKLNVDENQHTAMHYEVMSIPTMILFRDGVEKKRLVGARPKAALVAELSEFLA